MQATVTKWLDNEFYAYNSDNMIETNPFILKKKWLQNIFHR